MDKTVVFVTCVIGLLLATIIAAYTYYSFRDQTVRLEIEKTCANAGGVFLESMEHHGCVKIEWIGK